MANDEDQDDVELYFPMLDRMVEIGLLTAWRFADERLELTWSESFHGLGPGDRVFRRFAVVLSALCPEQGLDEQEQATLLTLATVALED